MPSLFNKLKNCIRYDKIIVGDKMKKSKILLISLTILICLFTGFSVMAAEDVVLSLVIDNPVMEVNGVECEIDAGRGTKPVVTDGRTLVPIRAIIEAFGGEVLWEESTQSVILNMDNDSIRLCIDSNIAYLNGVARTLDVSPTVINGRTMLPIRFVAEGFGLGVAWDGNTQTVYIISDSFTDAEYERLKNAVPEYSGNPYCIINQNNTYFEEYEIIPVSFEYYSELDELGRCDVCISSVAKDIMPTEDRGSISSVTPTGWINAKYDVVPGGYLYNRCHLIGFQLTGENANDRNLITGTRYLNVEGMLPFENEVAEYIKNTGNRVMYRITPVFSGDNLVADGVLMEAYSVEDNGAGISFCVYCYNVQPNVIIDYLSGRSTQSGYSAEEETQEEVTEPQVHGIYRTPKGKKYHFDPDCGGKNSYQVTMDQALAAGLTPCKKCAQ